MLDRTGNIKLSLIKENTGQLPGLPRNPRLIKDDRYQKLKKSIEDDPEMLDLRELIIFPTNGSFICIAGNMRLKVMRELKFKDAPCKILKPGIPADKLRAIAVKDNVSFGENDLDILANEFDVEELNDWGVNIPHINDFVEQKKLEENDLEEEDDDEDKEAFYNSMLKDCLYASDNPFDIPVLDIEKQATNLLLPFAPWGADSRLRKDVGTYHFYVDDYRFENIFKDPVKVLTSNVRQIVEPNLSLYDTTPIAYGLHLIYKKRWISRYFQECGILVYADLNVAQKFQPYNQMGIPKGWNAFFTRGYNDRINYLKDELKIAKTISQKENPNLIVYGGGNKIKKFCEDNSLLYTEQFMQDKK